MTTTKLTVSNSLGYLCPTSRVLLGVEVAVSEEPPLLQAELHQAGDGEEHGGGGGGVQRDSQGQPGQVEGRHRAKHDRWLTQPLERLTRSS